LNNLQKKLKKEKKAGIPLMCKKLYKKKPENVQDCNLTLKEK
jgi:hypothetical protein